MSLSRARSCLLAVVAPCLLLSFSGCGAFEPLDPGAGGGGGGGAVGGGSGGSGGGGGGSSGTGGGAAAGTPVRVQPTTSTTAIPSASTACSGSTLGSKGDRVAVNTPVSVTGTAVSSLTLRCDLGVYFGEPTRKAVVAWNGTGALSSLLWLAEVHSPQGRQYVTASGQRVFASFTVGADSTGSPSWSQTFVTWDDGAGATAYGVTDVAANGQRAGSDVDWRDRVGRMALADRPAQKNK